MINELYTVKPVNPISGAVAIGTYKYPAKIQDSGGYRKFSEVLEDAEKEKIKSGNSTPDFALSLYNKEARLLFYQ